MRKTAYSVALLTCALVAAGCEDPELPRQKPTTPTVPGPGEDGFEVVVPSSGTIGGIPTGPATPATHPDDPNFPAATLTASLSRNGVTVPAFTKLNFRVMD